MLCYLPSTTTLVLHAVVKIIQRQNHCTNSRYSRGTPFTILWISNFGEINPDNKQETMDFFIHFHPKKLSKTKIWELAMSHSNILPFLGVGGSFMDLQYFDISRWLVCRSTLTWIDTARTLEVWPITVISPLERIAFKSFVIEYSWSVAPQEVKNDLVGNEFLC